MSDGTAKSLGPANSKSPATKPSATKPSATKSSATKPSAAKPSAAKAPTSKSPASKTAATESPTPRSSAASSAPVRWRSGQQRSLQVRLLGGLVVWVTTLYLALATPKKRGKKTGRGKEGAGLYPELGVLGIQEGNSPALIYTVGRLTALLPSYEHARDELAERGVPLNIKVVHGVGRYAGQAALTFRRRQLLAYRAGQLPAGDGRGKRFGVMIDGGRTKLRRITRKQKGVGKNKTQRRRFQTEWREPKVIIIFEMDRHGRMKKGTKPIIEGTFEGPDEIMEILAMRLHQLGAVNAEIVAYRADGAPWIWERLDWVTRRVGLKPNQVSRGLDWCHAVHHISLALGLLMEPAERQRVYKKLRKWLRAGSWTKVVRELRRLAKAIALPESSEFWTEINYLNRHGEAGHLDYAKFRRRGLPMGSGAIESTIRRVINLRMKGNSIFWKAENAEALLVLRGLVLSGHWKSTFAEISHSLARDRHRHWKWLSPDMPAELKSNTPISPPQPQVASITGTYVAVA